MSRTEEVKVAVADGVDPSVRATVDASKRLLVSASGNTTPGDLTGNPVYAVDAASYLMAWDDTNEKWVRVQIDPLSHNLVAIRHSHHEVHEGNSYIATMVAALAGGQVMYCQMTTPASPLIHGLMVCGSDGNGVTIDVFEAPTNTSGGTPVPIYNRNRTSIKTTGATFVHTPTVVDTGTTLIRSTHIGSKNTTASPDRSLEELILKPSTKYLIRLTVDAATSTIFSGEFNWYEE